MGAAMDSAEVGTRPETLDELVERIEHNMLRFRDGFVKSEPSFLGIPRP